MTIRKIITFTLLGFLLCTVGCSKPEKSLNPLYLRCNETSNGKMAEVEDGYYLYLNSLLYYADKTNMEEWIPVCNKPDCMHKDSNCHAYLIGTTTFWQKGNDLYETDMDPRSKNPLYIYSISSDGSGKNIVYEIPTEGMPSGQGKATFQDEFVIRYNYLNEEGLLKENIISIKEDEYGKVNTYTLYEETVKNASLLISGNEMWGIRGDNLVATTLYLDEGDIANENLCKINNNKIEPLNLPDDISLSGGYFKDNVFTYYNKQEGFYQYNIVTRQKKLLFENQLENAIGYILSEDCMIEYNLLPNSVPEKASLKLYNGEEWLDVKLPKEVADCHVTIAPLCIASDRIFFRLFVARDTQYFYSIMLDEENPKLTYAGKIGYTTLEEVISEKNTEAKEDDANKEEDNDVYDDFKEVTVFDEEEYVVKITDVYLDDNDRLRVKIYLKNNSTDKTIHVKANHWTINGIQCDPDWGTVLFSNQEENVTIRLYDVIDYGKISEFYNYSEYTDIGLGFHMYYQDDNGENVYLENEFIHIYPQGEENASTYVREPQETDLVLIDNENVSVIITGYEKEFVSNDTINVVIQNKTDQYIKVKVENAKANDISLKYEPGKAYFGAYYVFVNPGAVTMYPMTLFNGQMDGPAFSSSLSDSFFKTNNITTIEKIEIELRISEYFEAKGVTKDWIYDTFTLIP